MGATHVEKSTVDASRGSGLNAVTNATAANTTDTATSEAQAIGSQAPKACSILDPDCDACQ